ncbi:MAG TPA: hypothetical protein VIO94_09585 [Phenylobacterium sp.]
MPEVSFQPVLVASRDDSEGQLVFADSYLIGVLVRLSSLHEAAAGSWFLEQAFGGLAGPAHPAFDDLDAARAWFERRLPLLRLTAPD